MRNQQATQSGLVTISLKDGSVYVGEIQDRKMHGQGEITFPNGSKYEGGWENDEMNGCGTLTYANGSKYEGEWKNDEMNGCGTLTYSDGEKYEGEWKNDKMHGQGTLISPSGEITATGEYCDGRLEKLQSVTITKGDKRHFFEYKDGKLFYTSPGSTESIEIDLKTNKRILSALEQFANTHVNQKSDGDSDLITVKNPEDFQKKIEEFQKQSKESKSTIIQNFEIPGHAFVMVFENGEIYCFDNGGLNNESFVEYRNKLNENNIEYHELNFEELSESSNYNLNSYNPAGKINIPINKREFACRHRDAYNLTFYTHVDEIKIPIDKEDFVCRHRATTIFQKLQEFFSINKINVAKRLLRYYFGNEGMIRINSSEGGQFREISPKIDSCSQLAGELQQHNQL